MTKPRVLLVNPPIYDFAAYDFWLRPYGMLKAAGQYRAAADCTFFDFMDRLHPDVPDENRTKSDRWNRGPFPSQHIDKPDCLKDIPRLFNRFGLAGEAFERFLKKQPPFDLALIQTTMTYWYPGYTEVIQTLRNHQPGIRILLGGFYASLLPEHALSIGADAVISDQDHTILRNHLGEPAEDDRPPLWELYPNLRAGVLTLSSGCPFSCTYCATGSSSRPFTTRPLEHVQTDLHHLIERGVTDIAFYDDALLYKPEKILLPFLEYVRSQEIRINFHTPNALHARLLTPEIAFAMVAAGFKTFHLGFESSAEGFHKQTGSKVSSPELESAVKALKVQGVPGGNIVVYEMLGHPRSDLQRLEQSIDYAHSLGVRVMLSDFSPIPGTPDGEAAAQWTDLSEPLNHNKTAFPIRRLGVDTVNDLKFRCKKHNRSLPRS